MTTSQPRPTRSTSSGPHTQASRDVPNIVVMVGGTVDPGNTSPTARSASYRTPGLPQNELDPNHYWGTNPLLLESLAALRQKYTNLHLFVAHGWSGDNAVTNRRIAGAYLADRLCGAGRLDPYYPRFLRDEVSFHLVGHSHGGNVINEFTRRAATSPEWPRGWKIRSITYLSTPFFQRLHPVHTGAFHPECRVLNVFCKYDLTQRVIADFSLNPLHDVLKQAGMSEVTAQLGRLRFNTAVLERAFRSVGVEDVDDRLWSMDLRLMMGATEGAALYREVVGLLTTLRGVFDRVRGVIEHLTQGINFPVPTELRGKVVTRREVMSSGLAARFRMELGRIEAGLRSTESAFNARLRGGRFPLQGFFDDIHVLDFLAPLVSFISVDRRTLQGPLWNLVRDFLLEQVGEFDNTTTSPAAQLRGTPFASRIVSLDVSSSDHYYVEGRDAVFNRFISRLETIEARYAQTRSQHALMDLLFTLLAHLEPLRTLVSKWASVVDWYEGYVRNVAWLKSKVSTLSRADRVFVQLVQVLENYALLFRERDCGQLQVDKPKKPLTLPMPLGSLAYFAMMAHSTSRQALYPQVQRALEAQFDTRTRRGGR